MCQIFAIQVSFLSSERLELGSRVNVIKILFNLNSQGNEKFEFFSQAAYDFRHLGNETLFIADHQNAKKSAFDWLA